MAHNYIVTAQKPTAVNACVTGEWNCSTLRRNNPKCESLVKFVWFRKNLSFDLL